MREILASILLVGVAVTAVAADASAQGRRHVYRAASQDYSPSGIPLTVNRRSWLDPGPVVTQGTEQAYLQANTIDNRTQDRILGPDRYGNDVIRGQPYVPGRTVPVVEFSSEPDGTAVVENTLGYQNYYFNPAPSVAAPSYEQTLDRRDLPSAP